MSGYQVNVGSALDAKVYGAAVFAGVQQQKSFMNLLSGEAPKIGDAASKLKGQSSPDMPIDKIMDLTSKSGDRVSVDLFNIFSGKPVMGDKRIEGKGMTATTSSADIYINRSRGMADTGGKMTQQRTVHNLRTIIQAGLEGWAGRLEDQRCLIQLAGARGYQATADWVVPLSTDPDFSEIVVNTVQAPTYNRRFFAMYTGTGVTPPTSIAGMTNAGALTLSEIDAIGSLLFESNVPLQNIKLKDDEYEWNEPLYVMFVTERQWAILKKVSGALWQSALSTAIKRFDGTKRHPLFMGDSIMWNGILVKKLSRYAIRFPGGSTMMENNATSTAESSVTVSSTTSGFSVDRAFIIGAQALIKAYGKEGSQGSNIFAWNEELVDHKSAVEISLAMTEGTAKTRFTINGQITDHGVAVIDSYAPAVGTTEFNSIVTASAGKY